MPLSLHNHRVVFAAIPVPCVSGSEAALVSVFTVSTQYLLVPVFRLPVSCCSHFKLSLFSYHNENTIDASKRCFKFTEKPGSLRRSFSRSVPFKRGGVLQVCSDVPVVHGTGASYQLQVPGSGHRYIAALVFHLCFIPIYRINFASPSCNRISSNA